MVWGTRAIAGGLAVVGLLLTAPSAMAVTPVTCAGLSAAVNSADPGEVLQLPTGTCLTNLNNVSNTNAFTLEGASGGGTVLKPANAPQPIISSSDDVHFTLRGLTFTGATQLSAISLEGAGEAVTITGNAFTNNTYPNGLGGAVSIQVLGKATTNSPTVISNNTFSGNHADLGGAIASRMPMALVVSGNTFTSNGSTSAGFGDGGAMYVVGSRPPAGAIQVSANKFVANTATDAGGAAALFLSPSQVLSLAKNSFQANKLTGNHTAKQFTQRAGGAVYIAPAVAGSPGTVTQSANKFTSNEIDETEAPSTPAIPAVGGAEWIIGTDVSSSRDQFIGNRVAVNDGKPPEGGAVGAFASAAFAPAPARPAKFTASDDVFRQNSTAAHGWGGAIYVGVIVAQCMSNCPGSTVVLNNSTLTGNRVDAGSGSEGGAIWGTSKDHLTLRNSIVSGNSPKPEVFGFGGSSQPIRFSDMCSEAGGPSAPKAHGNICAAPRLTAAGAETASSPTVDRGSNSLVPSGLSVDLLGNPRVRASRLRCHGKARAIVDMGAFEFTTTIPTACPHLSVRSGKLVAHNGQVAVKLRCRGTKSYCDGTVRLTTVAKFGGRRRGLGKHHFHIRTAHAGKVMITLSPSGLGKLGNLKSVEVVVAASAKDAAKNHAKARRTLLLKLR